MEYMPLYCTLETLESESDVEQKLILPFLTLDLPMGLGIKKANIYTKKLLRGQIIGKGSNQKNYFPDYLVSIQGIPLLVLEAKKPKESLEKAYSEARLYASEINARFKHGVNSCQFVIACNGNEMWVGYTDQGSPQYILKHEELEVQNPRFSEVLEFCSVKVLDRIIEEIFKKNRGKTVFKTPVSALGGKKVQNEELEENEFGRLFVFHNRKIFDPETENERRIIVKNAYVKTAKREQHAEPIYKEIKKFAIPGMENVTMVASDNPVEIVSSLATRINEHHEEYSLMLLIGNVGSGKSTFIRHFKEIYLQETNLNLANRCDWVFVNMNLAPLAHDEIYEWIKVRIIEQLKQNHSEIDFDNIEMIKRLFKHEVLNFEKGLGQLLKLDKKEYNKELYSVLSKAMKDNSSYLEAITEYLRSDNGLIPIIVIDNCDKRTKEAQLLMFEVAQWLRTTYKCIVFLPMRDDTYDIYRNEPPLDTVVKDLVFRIDPPDLLKVLQARIDYISRISVHEKNTYSLENGMNVSVKEEELLEYFKAIMEAIRRNRMVMDVFYRLANRNTREGIEIFQDLCKSGHIKTDEILGMRAANDYSLSLHKFMNALLRRNRKYYHDGESKFVNVFSSDFKDVFPDPFVRVDILLWLNRRSSQLGPSNIKGMFKAGEMVKDLQLIGHNANVIRRELTTLIKRQLVMSETLMPDIGEDDLIKITITGNLHISLLRDMNYLSACCEDVLFMDHAIRNEISERLSSGFYLTKLGLVLNVRDLLCYLDDYRKCNYASPSVYLQNGEILSVYDLQESKAGFEKFISGDSYLKEQLVSFDKYPKGKKVEVQVVHKEKGGVVVTLSATDGIKGFLSQFEQKYCMSKSIYDICHEGDWLSCEIIEYDYVHNSYQLKYLSLIADKSKQ